MTWHLPILWFCLAEDKVVLGSTFWQYGFPSFVLGHFFLLGANLGLGIEWAEACTTFWPHNTLLVFCLSFESFYFKNNLILKIIEIN